MLYFSINYYSILGNSGHDFDKPKHKLKINVVTNVVIKA